MLASRRKGRDVICNTGAVIIDEKGNLQKYCRGRAVKVDSPIEAELVAILRGIKEIETGRGKRVIIFLDCSEAVLAIKNKEVLWNRGGYTLDSILKN